MNRGSVTQGDGGGPIAIAGYPVDEFDIDEFGSVRQVIALVAALLFMNELVPEDAVMNSETLPAVVMPARDRFVADNRRGGAEIR